MALKTFNLDKEVYDEFSRHCKKEGISMSRKVENYIREEMKRLKKGIRKKEGKTIKKGYRKMAEHHSFSKYC
jgi:hypothetical protein